MDKTKTIFILGGTGFVGRAVTEKYLKNSWRVIIPTRAKNLEKAKSKLLLHDFNENFLEESISNSLLLFALDVDLVDKKWFKADAWTQLFERLNVSPLYVLRIVNLVGETSKSANEILESNINTLESIFTLAKYIKNQNKNSLFINMGSVAEKKQKKKSSPYEYSKKIARQKVEESNLCDFHFVAHYIKGRGEQKMKLAAPILWSKLRFSRRWLFGFKVSVVNVDYLAKIIYHFLEVIEIPSQKQKPIEVNVTNGELVFGEIVKNLLPEDKRNIPKTIIPIWFEKFFLRFYSIVMPIIKPNNQFTRRLAKFAKRSLINFENSDKIRFFKTAEDIKKIASDNNYEVLEINPNLIVLSKHYPVIYVLKEKSQKELKQMIQRALISYN